MHDPGDILEPQVFVEIELLNPRAMVIERGKLEMVGCSVSNGLHFSNGRTLPGESEREEVEFPLTCRTARLESILYNFPTDICTLGLGHLS